MENYVELTVKTTHEGAELVADLLESYSDSGVSILDVQDVIDLTKNGKNWDYADDKIFSLDETVLVRAYYKIENESEYTKEIENLLYNLKINSPFNLGSLETQKKKVDGEMWREKWKEFFKPIKLGNIVIVPEWIKYEVKDGEIPVYLDSNMAFGTGEHETTSMCVEFLQKYVKESDVVIDVGSGSGILGISASKLGAKEVVMTDIDECAVTASKKNSVLNGIKNAKVLLKNLLDDEEIKGNVIVANIIAEVLVGFSKDIGKNLFDGGYVILSGILTDRIDKVITAYENAGFTLKDKNIKGEWCALVFKKN